MLRTETRHPTPDTFTHFVISAQDDPCAFVQNTLQYNLHLMKAGAPMSTTHLFPKGGHGFGLCQGFKTFQQVCDWPQAARRFLQDIGAAPGFPASPFAPACA